MPAKVRGSRPFQAYSIGKHLLNNRLNSSIVFDNAEQTKKR